MKNQFIILVGIIAVFFVGCTEERDYRIGSVSSGNVKFEAINTTVSSDASVDYAESSIYYYGFYEDDYRENELKFTLDFTYEYEYENQTGVFYPLNIYLYYSNTLWAGGNNDIKVVFTPSCPEEKSAEFSFPDGQTIELSRENQSFIWQLNHESYNKAMSLGYDRYLPIYAVSKYMKDGIEYVNCGYVLVSLDNEGSNLFFDKTAGVWFMGNWRN